MTCFDVPTSMRKNSSVCFDCFMSLEKYDELQKQSKEIEVKLTNMFHKNRSNEVFIKEEFEFEDDYLIESATGKDLYDEQSFNDASMSEEDSESNEEELIEKIFICDHCGAKYTTEDNFLRHMKEHVQVDENRNCEECSKVFKSTARLQFHLATDHDRLEPPFDCPICYKKYQDRTLFQSHYIKHSQEKKYLCTR